MRLMKVSLAALALGIASPAMAADMTPQDEAAATDRHQVALDAVDIFWPEGQGMDFVNHMVGPFADMMLDTPVQQLAKDFGMKELFSSFAILFNETKDTDENGDDAQSEMPDPAEMEAGADMMLAMLGDKTLRDIIGEKDPHFDERVSIVRDVLASELPPILNRAEPKLRDVLAGVFARKFSDDELRDIAAFAQSPTGQKYVDTYWTIGFDPGYYRAFFAAMPELVQGFPELGKTFEARMAHLPPMFPKAEPEPECEEGDEACLEAVAAAEEAGEADYDESYEETPESLEEMAAEFEAEAAAMRQQAEEMRNGTSTDEADSAADEAAE